MASPEQTPAWVAKMCPCKGCSVARKESRDQILDFLEERRYNFGIDSDRYEELTAIINLIKELP